MSDYKCLNDKEIREGHIAFQFHKQYKYFFTFQQPVKPV